MSRTNRAGDTAPGAPQVGETVLLVNTQGQAKEATIAVVNLDGSVNLNVGGMSWVCDIPHVPEGQPSNKGWRRPVSTKKVTPGKP